MISPNDCRDQREREQSMRDRFPTGRFACGAFHVDVDPLLVASRFGELVDAILGDFHPVADADLGADGALEVVKVFEHAHLATPVVRLANEPRVKLPIPAPWSGRQVRLEYWRSRARRRHPVPSPSGWPTPIGGFSGTLRLTWIKCFEQPCVQQG